MSIIIELCHLLLTHRIVLLILRLVVSIVVLRLLLLLILILLLLILLEIRLLWTSCRLLLLLRPLSSHERLLFLSRSGLSHFADSANNRVVSLWVHVYVVVLLVNVLLGHGLKGEGDGHQKNHEKGREHFSDRIAKEYVDPADLLGETSLHAAS